MPNPVIQLIADVLKTADRAEITDVQVGDNGVLTVTFQDKSQIYVRVSHEAPTKASTPTSPSWPGVARATSTQPAGGRK